VLPVDLAPQFTIVRNPAPIQVPKAGLGTSLESKAHMKIIGEKITKLEELGCDFLKEKI